MSPTGILFSYAIGVIFAAGGIAFLVGLEDNRLLFGLPYLIIGLLIIGGVGASQRRRRRAAGARPEGAEPGDDRSG